MPETEMAPPLLLVYEILRKPQGPASGQVYFVVFVFREKFLCNWLRQKKKNIPKVAFG